MTAHGKNLDITTYTGGCGTKEVDVNPQLLIKVTGIIDSVSVELVDASGRRLAWSGNMYWGAVQANLIPMTQLRWHEPVLPGGVEVHVYVQMDGELVKDTARCAT
jgi:hypothetical protein